MLKIELLRFFVKHGSHVVYDPEPVFRDFIEQYAGPRCALPSSSSPYLLLFRFSFVSLLLFFPLVDDSVIALETFMLCEELKPTLLSYALLCSLH